MLLCGLEKEIDSLPEGPYTNPKQDILKSCTRVRKCNIKILLKFKHIKETNVVPSISNLMELIKAELQAKVEYTIEKNTDLSKGL